MILVASKALGLEKLLVMRAVSAIPRAVHWQEEMHGLGQKLRTYFLVTMISTTSCVEGVSQKCCARGLPGQHQTQFSGLMERVVPISKVQGTCFVRGTRS